MIFQGLQREARRSRSHRKAPGLNEYRYSAQPVFQQVWFCLTAFPGFPHVGLISRGWRNEAFRWLPPDAWFPVADSDILLALRLWAAVSSGHNLNNFPYMSSVYRFQSPALSLRHDSKNNGRGRRWALHRSNSAGSSQAMRLNSYPSDW